jgi:hypothetical protein
VVSVALAGALGVWAASLLVTVEVVVTPATPPVVVFVWVVVVSSSPPQAPSASAAARAKIAAIRLIARMIAEPAAVGGNFARKLGALPLRPASVAIGTIGRMNGHAESACDHLA